MEKNSEASHVFMRELFDSLTSLCSFEQVIQCVYNSLEKFIPVSFIMCYYVNHYTSHATTLGYAGNIIDQHRLEATKIHLLSEQMRKEHAYIKDKKIFWMNDYRQDAVVSKNLENIFPNNFSIICITINDTDLGHIILAFATGQNSVFLPQHVELISDNYSLFQSIINTFYPFGEEPQSIVETPLEQAETSVNILKKCKGMRHVVNCAEAVAKTDICVLIEGETGSGKEVLAKAIHLMSKRAQHPIVACNCGALTDSLVDSLLFGHEKGAFTDARAASKGFFEQAQNSTLFLDEVGELSPAAQVRLLRVLETRSIRRVGSEKVFPINVRIIAATNRDLKKEVMKGRFREDLWYRLNHYHITIPPLRQRREDIPILASYFCSASPGQLDIPGRYTIPEESMHNLILSPWPGNVRQLKHVIERAMVDACIMHRTTLVIPLEKTEDSPQKQQAEQDDKKDLPVLNRELEKNKELLETIKDCHGRISGPKGAAARLGLHPQTIRSKLFRMGISPKSLRESSS